MATTSFRDEMLYALSPNTPCAPAIISVALTGAIPEKKKYPSLPTQPEAIAEQALLCAELGASVVHLHMRDEAGVQTQDAEKLSLTIGMIRHSNPDIIVCATTTSRGANGLADRMVPLRLHLDTKPDLASLTLGSYNTPHGVNLNPREDIEALAIEMGRSGIAPEVEVFDSGMLYSYLRLLQKGRLEKAALVNILLGVDGAAPARARELVHMVELVPADTEWAVAGIGIYQKSMVMLGALLGGNIRVGMEDDPKGEWAGWTNMDSVKRAVRLINEAGREVATVGEARKRLGIGERAP